GRFHDSGHSLWERTVAALRLNLGVLLGAVPGIVVYLVGHALGLAVEQAALVAVWCTAVLLGVVGFFAAYRAGARGGRLGSETALAAACGGVVIAVKYLLHRRDRRPPRRAGRCPHPGPAHGAPSPGAAPGPGTVTPDGTAQAAPGDVAAFTGSRPDPRYVDHREHVSFVRAPFAARTWREYGYLWLAILLAPFAFAYGLFSVTFLVAMLVPVLGLVLAGWVVVGGRGWGSMYRSIARSTLGVDVAAPAPYVRRKGFWSTLWHGIGDGTGWRAVLFLLVTFPLAIVAF